MELDPKIIRITQKQFRRQHERGYHDKLLLVVRDIGIDGAQFETELGEIEIWQSDEMPEGDLLIGFYFDALIADFRNAIDDLAECPSGCVVMLNQSTKIALTAKFSRAGKKLAQRFEMADCIYETT